MSITQPFLRQLQHALRFSVYLVMALIIPVRALNKDAGRRVADLHRCPEG